MDGFLFNPSDFTDERLRSVMEGNTCRKCAYRQIVRQGYEGRRRVSVCIARKSARSSSGFLRVSVDQPVCILFSQKTSY